MKKIKSGMIILVVAALFAVVVAHAESDKRVQSAKIKPKASTEIQPAPISVPQTSPLTGSKQGYQMVTDVLDAFGGESESDSFRIPVNSGGQPSAIGISASDNYLAKAGFVHSSHVMHGDANGDANIGPGDIVYLLNYLYRSDDPPCPMESGDANCDGGVGPGDIVYLLNYLYRGGPSPSC